MRPPAPPNAVMKVSTKKNPTSHFAGTGKIPQM